MEQTTNTGGVTEQAPARPTFLTVLCILSFIGSGLSALGTFIGIFASGWLISSLGSLFMSKMNDASNIEAMQGMDAEKMEKASGAVSTLMNMGSGVFIAFFAVLFVLFGLSLWGAIKMWGLKKSGFIMYVIPNGLLFILSLISFNILGILINGGFITMYAVNYKHLK